MTYDLTGRLTDDLSASRSGLWHGKLGIGAELKVRKFQGGADNETAERSVEGNRKRDHLVEGSWDHQG